MNELENQIDTEMLPKYAKQYSEGSNIVVLSPDVAEAFPDSEAVNEALRTLIRIARQ